MPSNHFFLLSLHSHLAISCLCCSMIGFKGFQQFNGFKYILLCKCSFLFKHGQGFHGCAYHRRILDNVICCDNQTDTLFKSVASAKKRSSRPLESIAYPDRANREIVRTRTFPVFFVNHIMCARSFLPGSHAYLDYT